MKSLIITLVLILFPFSLFAYDKQPVMCRNLHFEVENLKAKVNSIDQNVKWNSQNCKVVYTRSLFPRNQKNGTVRFEHGLELFFYQDNQLKVICIPGWECRKWQ
jgi:hypothetical protein